jgi:hypothetical protein
MVGESAKSPNAMASVGSRRRDRARQRRDERGAVAGSAPRSGSEAQMIESRPLPSRFLPAMVRVNATRPVVTTPRIGVSLHEVAQPLWRGLGPRYYVVMGVTTSWYSGRSRPGGPDVILVGAVSNRFWRAHVRIVWRRDGTSVCVSPGGVAGARLFNAFGIVRRVRRVLREAPELARGRSRVNHATKRRRDVGLEQLPGVRRITSARFRKIDTPFQP